MLSRCVHTNKHCVFTQTANTAAHKDPQRTKSQTFQSQHSQGDPNISKPASTRTPSWPCIVNERPFQKIQQCDVLSLTLAAPLFSPALQITAKYQQDVPPDTLTFQLSPLLSHNDSLVLSETDRLKISTCECIKHVRQNHRFSFKKMLKTWR